MFVRQPLMILPTLPRVIGPDEQITMPVSVFASDASIKDVKLEVETDARFAAVGATSTTLTFTKPEEKLGFLALKSGSKLGQGQDPRRRHQRQAPRRGRRLARGAQPECAVIALHARARSRRARPGRPALERFGLEGTQSATLEVSALPPLNLDGRLDYLIHYPHGCLEQTTSGVFPQLYLPALIKLDPEPPRGDREQRARGHRAAARLPARRTAASSTGPASGPRTPASAGATTGARPTPVTSCSKPRSAGYDAARRHEGRVAALPEDRPRSAGIRTRSDVPPEYQRRRGRGRALCAGVSPVHAGAGGAAGDRRDEPPARRHDDVGGRTLDAGRGVQARGPARCGQGAGRQGDSVAGLRVRGRESLHLRLAAARPRDRAAWA